MWPEKGKSGAPCWSLCPRHPNPDKPFEDEDEEDEEPKKASCCLKKLLGAGLRCLGVVFRTENSNMKYQNLIEPLSFKDG